jgi:type IV pilus biogenesis protein CpaD/CtpE
MPDDVPVQVDQQQKQNSLKDLLGGVVNRNANGEATSLTVAVKLGRLTNLTQSEASHKLDRLAQKEGINAQGAKSAETQMLEGAPYMVVTQQIAAP